MQDQTQDDQHPLSSGTTVGHYRIKGLIGQGGMGYVYRALDNKLVRDVALKCPLPQLAARPEQRLRFVREARAASRLDHPNIVPIYEVFEAEGLPWMVMSLVDGGSLRARLREAGALPVDEILRIGIDLTDALQAAHQSNILHRDVNPKNILLTVDGRAMLSDFGLARSLAPPEEDGETMGVDLTQEGRLVGTPAYMSPEQMLGETPDARSDLFSLGVVLHEMCTGRSPFDGPGLGAIVEAVIHKTPGDVDGSRGDLPVGLTSIVKAALAKQPDQRYQTAAGLGRDLRATRRQREFAEYAHSHPTESITVPFGRRRVRLAWLLSVVVLLAMAAVVAGIYWPRTDPFGSPRMEAVVTWPSEEYGARISPDGEWVSFISDRNGRRELWMTKVGAGGPHVITEQQGSVTAHAWSPDGREIVIVVFESEETFMQFIPAFGGPHLRSVKLPREAADYTVDRWIGTRIYAEDSRRGLLRFDTTTDEFERVLAREMPEGYRHSFHVRDDEKRVAFVVQDGDQMVLWAADLDGRNATALTSPRFISTNPRWLGRRHLVFTSNRSGQIDLWLLRVADRQSRQLTFSTSQEMITNVSERGSLLTFVEHNYRSDLWLADPAVDDFRQLTADALQDGGPSVSREQPIVAFHRSRPSFAGPSEIYESQLMISRIDALRDARAIADRVGCARISPDGRWVVYSAVRESQHELWLQEIDTGHRWRLADRFKLPWFHEFPTDWVDQPLAWSRDSSELFFVALTPDARRQVRRISLQQPDEPIVVVTGSARLEISDLFLSPDGRWLGYVALDFDASTAAVRLWDRHTGESRELLGEPVAAGNRFYLRGWLDDRALFVLKAQVNPDWSERIEPLRVGLEGAPRSFGMVPFAFGGTATLDVKRNCFYLTCSTEEEGPHNLVEFSLQTGEIRAITSNELSGISYSGIEILDDGRMLYSRQQQDTNLWSIRFER